MRKIILASVAILSLSGCSFFKETPAQQQATIVANEAKVIYFLQAAGCVAKDAAGTAQTLGISTVLDAQGNAVLTKVATGAGKACSLTVPAAAVAAAPSA